MPRRRRTRLPRGAGTVYEKRPGEWIVAWRENGSRRYSKSLPSRDLAERLRAKMEHDRRFLGAGLPLPTGSVPTLATLGDLWIERREKTHRAWRDDRSRWRKHVRPPLGPLRPADVDSAKLRALIEAKLAEGLDPATVGHIIRLVSTIFSDLLERPGETGVTVNPVRSLTRATRRLYRSTHRPEDTPFLTPDQAGELSERLAEPFRSMYLTGFYAMLRTGEVLGLHAEDVKADRSVIVVSRQVQDGDLGPLKDGETRTVPLQDALRPVLARAALKVGGRGPLWPTTQQRGGGRPGSPPRWMRPQTLHAALSEALGKDPALPEVTWYEATRHSGASAWVRAGGDMARLAAILGHSSTEVTRRYAHLRPDAWTDADRSRLSVGSPLATKRPRAAARKPRKA